VAELIGPKGNLLLLDPTGRVVEALLPKRLASRRLSPGDLYEPPPRPATNANEDRGLSVDELADQIERAERQFEFEASVARLAGVLARERKRLRKYLEKQRGEFANLPHAETLTRQAETLLAYLHLAKKGQTNVSLPNLYEADGAALVVPLDPAKSPKENAEAMFKTARRSRRKGEGLRARIAEMEAQEQKLTAIAAEIERATDLAGMARVEERMRAGGIKLAEERERQPAKAEKAKKSGAQPFVAADGAHIFVGRNARENEELTFHVARGNDYWLHTEGAAGSHVIIKLPPNGELSSETLLDAASLAVLHSSIKSAGGGSVIYTRCKNVRRPKNAPTGQVYAGSTRSIFIRLDEQRLARLYASRE
jgi:predicted ribosome quality control (RQC) complex YloA/Tae2 family protein